MFYFWRSLKLDHNIIPSKTAYISELFFVYEGIRKEIRTNESKTKKQKKNTLQAGHIWEQDVTRNKQLFIA